MSREAQGSLATGSFIGGRFRITTFLGKGGMGEVYAASHVGTGRQFALKVLVAAAQRHDLVRRFLREARAASAIDHPNVVKVYDIFEDARGVPVMVMELLEGESLASYEKRLGLLTLDDAARLFLPIAEALVATHQKGIVHRDLKPDNVFLARTEEGNTQVKLLDFGIAKLLDPASIGVSLYGTETNTGNILGTPRYMSFEQAMLDELIDERTDVWSFGAMLIEALSGRCPLEYDSLPGMYTAFLQEEVAPAQRLVPSLPADWAAVLDGCLQKDRAQRLRSLNSVVQVLAAHLGREPQIIPASQRRLRFGGTTVKFAVAVGVAAILVFAFLGSRRTESVISPEPSVALQPKPSENTRTTTLSVLASAVPAEPRQALIKADAVARRKDSPLSAAPSAQAPVKAASTKLPSKPSSAAPTPSPSSESPDPKKGLVETLPY